ncbi:MAG TPA: hypothetical protein PLX35_04180 [Cyclobacteriaceae bacterium]|nr:hypothetical protein [Cyclobacteriaceae bacterium]
MNRIININLKVLRVSDFRLIVPQKMLVLGQEVPDKFVVEKKENYTMLNVKVLFGRVYPLSDKSPLPRLKRMNLTINNPVFSAAENECNKVHVVPELSFLDVYGAAVFGGQKIRTNYSILEWPSSKKLVEIYQHRVI